MTKVKPLKTFSIFAFACLFSVALGACADDDDNGDVMDSGTSAGQGTAGSTGSGSTTAGTTMGTSGSTTGGSTGTGSSSTSSGMDTDDCMETGGTGGDSLIPGVDGGECPEFVECIFSTCGTQVNQCFGDIANAMPGGDCESYLQCVQNCSCNSTDPNCAANCFQNADNTCQICLTSLGLCAATSCQEAKNACDESTGTGSTGTGGDTAGMTTGS